MSPKKHQSTGRTDSREVTDRAFIFLLSGRLKNRIIVPNQITSLGGLSLKTLAIASRTEGMLVDQEGRTKRYRPSWLPNVEIMTHFSLDQRLSQIALCAAENPQESSLIVHKYEEGLVVQTKVTRDGEETLPPRPLRYPEHPDMRMRQQAITQLAVRYINGLVFPGRAS